MSILEILEAHTYHAHTTPHSMGYWAHCTCGWTSEGQRSHDYDFTPEHRAHLAQVLEQHEREATAEALEEAAAAGELLDPDPEMYDKQLNAVPVWTWLRTRAAQLKESA